MIVYRGSWILENYGDSLKVINSPSGKIYWSEYYYFVTDEVIEKVEVIE